MKEKIIDNIKYLYENDTIYDIQFISQDISNDTIIIPSSINDTEITNINMYVRDRSQISEFSICSDEFYFKKLIISDNIIDIENHSFNYLNCDEVVWSSRCKTIPRGCFSYSQIRRIENIDHVTLVELSAFYECSKLEKIVWPAKCDNIPVCCFFDNVSLEKIENINHVEHIGNDAFYNCRSLKTFRWPSLCKSISTACFSNCFNLESITNIEHVTTIKEDSFRYCESLKEIKLTDEIKIYENSFTYTNLTLDLSQTSLFNIDKQSLKKIGIEKGKIILPYFYDEEEIIL